MQYCPLGAEIRGGHLNVCVVTPLPPVPFFSTKGYSILPIIMQIQKVKVLYDE